MSYFVQRDELLRSIEKTVISPGEAADFGSPTRFDTVEMLLTIHTMEGEEILVHQNRSEPFKTKIGDLDLQRGISLAASTMTRGEKSRFIIPDELMVEGREVVVDPVGDATEKKEVDVKPVPKVSKATPSSDGIIDEEAEGEEEEDPEDKVQAELMKSLAEPESKDAVMEESVETTTSENSAPQPVADPVPVEQPVAKTVKPFCQVEIELLSWTTANGKANKWDLDDSEKLPWILKLKEQGNTHLKAEQWAEAQDCYNNAIEIVEWDQDPVRKATKVQCLYNLSIALAKQKKFVSALERITWAVNLAPNQAKGYYRRAGVYLEMSEFDRALEELTKGLDVEPGNTDLTAMVAKVKSQKLKYVQENCKMFSSILGKNVYENTTARTCDYSDNYSPRMSLDILRQEKAFCIEMELFENLLPETTKYVVKLIEAGLMMSYRCIEVQPENFLIFDSSRKIDSTFKEFKNEHNRTKITDLGFVFFRPNKETGNCCSEIGISLAPLPWYDNEWVPFGFVSKPVDLKKKLGELFEANFKNGVSEVKFGSAKVNSKQQ